MPQGLEGYKMIRDEDGRLTKDIWWDQDNDILGCILIIKPAEASGFGETFEGMEFRGDIRGDGVSEKPLDGPSYYIGREL